MGRYILVVRGQEGSNCAPVPTIEILPKVGGVIYCDGSREQIRKTCIHTSQSSRQGCIRGLLQPSSNPR